MRTEQAAPSQRLRSSVGMRTHSAGQPSSPEAGPGVRGRKFGAVWGSPPLSHPSLALWPRTRCGNILLRGPGLLTLAPNPEPPACPAPPSQPHSRVRRPWKEQRSRGAPEEAQSPVRFVPSPRRRTRPGTAAFVQSRADGWRESWAE